MYLSEVITLGAVIVCSDSEVKSTSEKIKVGLIKLWHFDTLLEYVFKNLTIF